MKSREEIMNMLEAFDLTGSFRDAGELARFSRNSRTRNGKDDRIIDYVECPRVSGYRAVHLRTVYRDRKVEVQLRTPGQHAWAVFVEELGGIFGHDLKSGRGPRGGLTAWVTWYVEGEWKEHRFPAEALMQVQVSRG